MEQRSDTRDKKQTVQRLTSQVPNFLVFDRYEADDFNVRNVGFSTKTCELVESNVLAKRYILTVDSQYIDNSKAITVSYTVIRGRTLLSTEIQEFEKNPLFKQKVQLTKWDDAAKATGIKPAALDTYRDMAIRNISMSMRTLY
ncbi:hypothetical protein GGI17_004910 [Coemansia sp. S146]|nr:hypothetical protein GGI17_004910 [Coemansia sp. S146]